MRKILTLWVFVCLSLQASETSRDIFTNTGQTRRQAQGAEFDIALGLNGCAGVLIGPTIGLSAAHCQNVPKNIKSGIALRDGLASDATIVRTLEIGSAGNFDYWVFELKWKNGFPIGMRLVPHIQTKENDLKIGANDTADKIYTLGFPADISQGRLIHSYGYGKNYSSSSLMNNISLINGNSDGGILRQNDYLLVSIVSGGPHAFQQPGWNNNDWNDSSHWNNGPALWKTYAQSNMLKSIFPNGGNKWLGRHLNLEAIANFLPLAQQLLLDY